MEIKAVIFDMDGVIVDTEEMYLNFEQAFYKHYGIYAPISELAKTVGKREQDCEDIYLALWDNKISMDEHKRRGDAFYENYDPWKELNYNEVMNDGVKEVLNYLKDNNYKIALASSSPMDEIAQVVEDCDIKEYFDYLVTGHDFKESKPNPAIYLHTLSLLGVNADEAVVVEDSTSGILASKGADIFTIAKKDDRFDFDQSKADVKIDNLKEIIEILKK